MTMPRFPDQPVKFNAESPLEKLPAHETTRSNIALRDYAYMRAGRSLRVLVARYQDMAKNWKPGEPKPPTTVFATIGTWSRMLGWQDRVKAFDKIMEEEDLIAFKREQEEWRKRRQTLLRVAYGKVGNSLGAVQPAAFPNLEQTVRAMAILNDQARKEFGDEGSQEIEDITTGKKVVISTRVIIPQVAPDLSDGEAEPNEPGSSKDPVSG